MQHRQDQSLTEFGDSLQLCLCIMFALNRTVQIWSRAPGTTGTWFFAFYFAGGAILQSWYSALNEDAGLYHDWIPFVAVMGLSLVWFSIHGITHAWLVLKGYEFHSYSPGRGIFESLFPNWTIASAGLASDVMIALALSVLFMILHSPILSGWYTMMCTSLVISHYWLVARDARRRQQGIDAQIEAAQWSENIRRRS